MDYLKSLTEVFSTNLETPPSSVQFIDAALSCTSPPFAPPYTDPNQICIIRRHLISLLQNYPSFRPSIDTFTHDDGNTANLLNANGELQVSSSTPAIPLTIWLHESYPFMAPIVLVSLNTAYPIYDNHPFVGSSGSISSFYLVNWKYPGCNLSDLVHNLIKIFSHNHPFYYSALSANSFHPSLASKREAVDRLSCTLHYDMTELLSKTLEQVEELSTLREQMVRRAIIAEISVDEHKSEMSELKERVKILTDEADKLSSWLRVNDQSSFSEHPIEDAFEATDENSKALLECLVADRATEDLIYSLNKVVEQGVVNLSTYLKQVRLLARDQFFGRAKLVKMGISLQWLD
ncbi:protein ELC-like [Nicotiana tabacum]|uniref:Protein ELC-like n=1 Tax=Nicotiana tabacum TaxID=4097 RepID=A0A1S4D6J9_TOBAC|nr:PREDICTED: protein ELC-like [Nicotiana tabacum]